MDRRNRQDRSAFSALIANPVRSSFILPANATLGFRRDVSTAKGVIIATATGATSRTLGAPALLPGQLHIVSGFERGTRINLYNEFNAFLHMGLGVYTLIATSDGGVVIVTTYVEPDYVEDDYVE